MRSRLHKALRKSRSQRKKALREPKRRRSPTFESLESRCLLAASPPLLGTIEGFDIDQNAFNTGSSIVHPPDPYGAAGPNHVVNIGNLSVQWFTKDGNPQMHTSLRNFFAPLRPQTSLFDPKVVYDQYEERFVALALEMMDASAGDPTDLSRIMLAVSDDSDPNGTWYYHSINSMLNIDLGTGGTPAITTFWADYPGMGLDEEAIYVTANMFELGGATIGGNRLWIVDKGAGTGGFYDNGSATVTLHDPAADTGVDFTAGLGTTAVVEFRSMQPAHVFGNAPAGVGTWLTLYDGNTNQTTDHELVDVIRVDDPLGTPAFTLTTIDVGDLEDPVNFPFPIPAASQKGSAATIDGGDRRTLNAVWRNNSLYTTTVTYPIAGPEINQVTAHWFRFDTSNANGPTLADQGDVSGEDLGFAVNTYWPAVNVDSQDNMAIGFAASGPTLYAGAYYAMRAADDDPGTLRDAVAIAEGLDVYDLGGGTNRWGDYTSVALDPSDEVTLWAYNEYALPAQGTTGRWGTRWGSFRMAPLPDAPAPGPTTISGIKWHDLDDDGRFDANEPGLGGIVIHVDLDGDGQFDFQEPTARTDAAGRYTITLDASAGPLKIRESIPPGWEQKYPGPNATVAFAHEVTVSATGGEAFTSLNFGNSDTVGFDHGDAPAPYPTLEANSGPTHPIVTGFGLGLLRDGEPDGLPDVNAAGDDNANVDDEDGVVLPDVLTPGATATATVIVSTGGRPQGRLQGWIDFNRDGDWNDPGEQIFRNLSLADGSHQLDFAVPTGAEPGTTYARFRYGYENDLPPTGPSPKGGEVEDYVVNVLSDEPIANNDQFTVDQDTTNNALDVLANDIPSSSGRQNLVLQSVNATGASGTAIIDQNGTPFVFTDDFVSYTPAPGAFAPDAFTYTIEDNLTGDTDTATVSVTVRETAGTAPVAVDDSYITTVTMDLPVLTNDRPGPNGPISIVDLDSNGTDGTIRLDGQFVEYTPGLAFSGTDQFRYTVMDANNVTSTATVTVQVPPNANDDRIRFRLETTDINGDPITEVGQGLEFQLRVYVDDLRGEAGHPPLDFGLTPVDQGVFSAYMDLLYDAGFVSYNGDLNLTYSPAYTSGRFVNSSVPGILDEIGAFQGDNSIPLGPNEELLLISTFTASARGTALFRSDPADNLPLHETSLNHPEAPVNYPQIEFGTASINIVESPDLVEIRLAVTDLNGVALPNNQIVAGNDFLLRAYTEDLRTNVPIVDEGVYSAYLDVFYSDILARPVLSGSNPLGIDISFGALFTDGQKVDTGASGILNEIGAFQGNENVTLFPGPELLFEIRFTALTPPGGFGSLLFDADQADFVPLNEVSLIKPDPGVSVPRAQVAYIDSDVITVIAAGGEGEFTNPRDPMDVNDDGETSPIDALILINFLCNQGSTDLTSLAAGGEGESSGSRYYYDVNADMVISPLDVLGVIGHLNSVAFQVGGEGEASGDSADTLASVTAVAEPIDMPLAFELSTLQLAEPSDLGETEPERHVPVAVTDRTDSLTSPRGVSTLEEVADETDGLAQILTDDLAEDILGAWSELPSDGELLPEMV